jgi:hypothetical protein
MRHAHRGLGYPGAHIRSIIARAGGAAARTIIEILALSRRMLEKPSTTLRSGVRRWSWIAGLVVLFGLVILLSPDLFRAPIVPYGDEAANSMRIFRAKHFEQLLGNFSRWQFHHPGPAYFYFLAAGEFVFYDLLRLTPAAFNAQILSSMLLSFVFAAGALAIFRRHFTSRAFPALAALMLALVAYTVNRSLPNLMLVSIWPPGWLLANFLFFVAAAVAVGAGDLAILPAMAAGGVLLAQGHASQAPFVVLISTGACACGVWRRRDDGSLRQLASRIRTRLIVSAAIVAVAAFPIVFEMCIHESDNLDAILNYVVSSRGHFNTFPQAVKFCAGFLLFTPDTERWAFEPLRGQVLAAAQRGWVVGFWMVTFALGSAVLARRRRIGRDRAAFVVSALLVCAIASAMFLVWVLKLTGEFYAFNGLFIYSLHVVGLWTLCGLLSERLPRALCRWVTPAALVGLAALVILGAAAFRNPYKGAPVIQRILVQRNRIPATGVRLLFDQDRWPVMMGVADSLARAGMPFCVGPQWAFMFEPERVCRNAWQWPALDFHAPLGPPSPQAFRLAETARLAVDVVPPESVRVPFTVGMEESFDEKEGFHATQTELRWTTKEAHIRFRLAVQGVSRCGYVVRVSGTVYPSRPVTIVLNGAPLGAIARQGQATVELAIPDGILRDGGDNDLALLVPLAARIGRDRRELGFGFAGAEIRHARGCP